MSKIKRMKKLLLIAYLSISKHGVKKAEFLKKHGDFKLFGNNNYWYSRNVPADMNMVLIHNNVKVATEVYFCTHDILYNLFNDDSSFEFARGDSKGTQNLLKFMTTYLLGQEAQLCMV